MNLVEINRALWFTRLKAQYILILQMAERIRSGPKENIDVQLKVLDELGRAVADAKRALLYFKNTPSNTPPRPPGSSGSGT